MQDPALTCDAIVVAIPSLGSGVSRVPGAGGYNSGRMLCDEGEHTLDFTPQLVSPREGQLEPFYDSFTCIESLPREQGERHVDGPRLWYGWAKRRCCCGSACLMLSRQGQKRWFLGEAGCWVLGTQASFSFTWKEALSAFQRLAWQASSANCAYDDPMNGKTGAEIWVFQGKRWQLGKTHPSGSRVLWRAGGEGARQR